MKKEDIRNTKQALKKCREDLEFYKSLSESEPDLKTSMQDFPFLQADKLLAKKYFHVEENLLENILYKFLSLSKEFVKKRLIKNNSVDVYLPFVNSVPELASYWKGLGNKEQGEAVREHLKLIVFSHYFKIKQLIGSFVQLVNDRNLLSVVLICRALFEHVSLLNSYYELYKVLIRKRNLNPSFQDSKKGKIFKKGDISKSFEKPFGELKKFQNSEVSPEFIFCGLVQRYLIGGMNDLRVYNKYENNWLKVFKTKSSLEFEKQEEGFLKLKKITYDINFLENKISHAHKWYSILCEFVHPNSGSHRTTLFKTTYVAQKGNKMTELPRFEELKEKKKEREDFKRNGFKLLVKHTLCSVSNYDLKQNYAFIIEAFYYPLIELIKLSTEIISDLVKDIEKIG